MLEDITQAFTDIVFMELFLPVFFKFLEFFGYASCCSSKLCPVLHQAIFIENISIELVNAGRGICSGFSYYFWLCDENLIYGFHS